MHGFTDERLFKLNLKFKTPDCREGKSNHRGTRIFFLFCVICIIVSFRLINLDSDIPTDFARFDIGLHVDEGYKTLAPRNIIEFANAKAHLLDDYPGWFKSSPLTQSLYYVAFSAFGVNIKSARRVTLLFLFLLLSSFLFSFQKKYSFALLLTGIFLIAFDSVIFHFSRVAIFEIPIASLIWSGILLSRNCTHNRIVVSMIVLCVLTILVSFTIKASSFIYLAPAIFAVVFGSFVRGEYSKRTLYTVSACGFVAVGFMLFLMRHHLQRVGVYTLDDYLARLFLNPLSRFTPLTMVAGMLATTHLITNHWNRVLRDNYLLSLIGPVLIGPILLALLSYNPLRYYVALVPAYILIFIEWVHCEISTRRDMIEDLKIPWFVRIISGICWVFLGIYIVQLVDSLVLPFLPLKLGDDPGISTPIKLKILPFLFPVFFVTGYLYRTFSFEKRWLNYSSYFLIGFMVLSGLVSQASIIYFPVHESDDIRYKISSIVPKKDLVAGDWAPLFTLGTGINSLYSNESFNRVDTFITKRPKYFISSQTKNDTTAIEEMRISNNISIGKILPLGIYLDRIIYLLEITYS